MALSQSVVSELLDAFHTGDAVDLIRESVRMGMQELIEAEATERVGAARATSGRSPARPSATAPARGCQPRRPATSS